MFSELISTALGTVIDESRLVQNVDLAPFTTLKIGGPADLFFEARTPAELAAAVTAARQNGMDWFVLGMGANILIGDRGFRGIVVHNRANAIQVDRRAAVLTADSGAICYPDVIEAAVSAGLSGLEHYVGIPSTVGGALWQNLHFLSPPPERERTMFIEEILHSAELLTEEGRLQTVEKAYFKYSYDYSILHDREDIVLSATFQLQQGDEARMREIIAANLEWRRDRHPPLDTEPSAGSIFKKIDGIGAGRLIDECGLKGSRIGGIEITHRHANIMINKGGGTASDVKAMIELVQDVVERNTGYRLVPEILFVGEF